MGTVVQEPFVPQLGCQRAPWLEELPSAAPSQACWRGPLRHLEGSEGVCLVNRRQEEHVEGHVGSEESCGGRDPGARTCIMCACEHMWVYVCRYVYVCTCICAQVHMCMPHVHAHAVFTCELVCTRESRRWHVGGVAPYLVRALLAPGVTEPLGRSLRLRSSGALVLVPGLECWAGIWSVSCNSGVSFFASKLRLTVLCTGLWA